jgi:hypothetical protein
MLNFRTTKLETLHGLPLTCGFLLPISFLTYWPHGIDLTIIRNL